MSSTYTFVSKNKDIYQIAMPIPADMDSFFAFSLVKAGSTLLNDIIKELCALNNTPSVSIYDLAFSQGIATNDIAADVDAVLNKTGYGYVGFRHYFNFQPTLPIAELTKILLVRDPRDMLTSLYFSVKYSHPVPEKGRSREMMLKRQEVANELTIDEFALRNAQSILNSFHSYMRVLDQPNWHLFKYEEVIEKKELWIQELAAVLKLPLSEEELNQLLQRVDVFPNEEKQHEHVRQVWPGNHKKHLSSSTIDQLNGKFETVLERFNYESN